MNYTIGTTIAGNQAVGIHIHLGAKETLAKSINVKPEQWDEWAKAVKDALATIVATLSMGGNLAKDDEGKDVAFEVIIETNDSLQFMDLEILKTIICS